MGVHDVTNVYPGVKEALGIPAGEPVFILRAQDVLTVPAIARYRNLAAQIEDPEKLPDSEWFRGIDEVIGEFQKWQTDNPEKIKVPD